MSLVCLDYAPNDDDQLRYLSNDRYIYVPNDALPCPAPLCGDTLVAAATATCTITAGTAVVSAVHSTADVTITPQTTTASVSFATATVTVVDC